MNDEQILGFVAVGSSPLRFQMHDGLVASVSKVFKHKVYTVLTTGNEKGSRTVRVTRP